MNLTIIKAWINAKFNTDERGASLVEYALLVALIAAVCVVAVAAIGTGAKNKFTSVSTALA
jgi:pilus assembly protein Flp/PilA